MRTKFFIAIIMFAFIVNANIIIAMKNFVLISLYVNSSLFVKYPQKQYNFNIFKILLVMHIPILNVFVLVRNLKQGKNNWENLVYEHK